MLRGCEAFRVRGAARSVLSGVDAGSFPRRGGSMLRSTDSPRRSLRRGSGRKSPRAKKPADAFAPSRLAMETTRSGNGLDGDESKFEREARAPMTPGGKRKGGDAGAALEKVVQPAGMALSGSKTARRKSISGKGHAVPLSVSFSPLPTLLADLDDGSGDKPGGVLGGASESGAKQISTSSARSKATRILDEYNSTASKVDQILEALPVPKNKDSKVARGAKLDDVEAKSDENKNPSSAAPPAFDFFANIEPSESSSSSSVSSLSAKTNVLVRPSSSSVEDHAAPALALRSVGQQRN